MPGSKLPDSSPDLLPADLQWLALELVPVEELEQQVSQQQIGQRGQEQVLQEDQKGIVQAAVEGDEQILGIADGAHDAAGGHGQGQREQEQLGGDLKHSGASKAPAACR